MESILTKINSLGTFELNLLSAAVFAALVFFTSFLYRKILKGGKIFVGKYAETYLYRYLAHHRIFGSEEIAEPLRIFFYVCLSSVAWLLVGLLILVFIYGVRALASGEWLIFLGHWFAFNSMFESFMWARDSRNDKTGKALFDAKFGKAENSKQRDQGSG